MTRLYILGLLLRFGPQHGYQLKKILNEQLSDFTQIKLPTIYYHLEKMQEEGLLEGVSEKPGSRPEKTVYSITGKGEEAFKKMLSGLLEFDYHPTFEADGAFFFPEFLDKELVVRKLDAYYEKLIKILQYIEVHQTETLEFVPEQMKTQIMIIFNHHLKHYHAELEWVEEAIKQITYGEK